MCVETDDHSPHTRASLSLESVSMSKRKTLFPVPSGHECGALLSYFHPCWMARRSRDPLEDQAVLVGSRASLPGSLGGLCRYSMPGA